MPTVAQMLSRRLEVLRLGLPYLVALREGRVVGYAYAGAYRARSAYRHTVEDSIYVAQGEHGRGIGKALLAALIERCAAQGLAPDGRGGRPQRQRGLDAAAREPRLRTGRRAARRGLQVRPLGRHRADAARAGLMAAPATLLAPGWLAMLCASRLLQAMIVTAYAGVLPFMMVDWQMSGRAGRLDPERPGMWAT